MIYLSIYKGGLIDTLCKYDHGGNGNNLKAKRRGFSG